MTKNIKLQQIEKTASGAIRSSFNEKLNHLFADGKINDSFVFDDNTSIQKIEKEVQKLVRPGKILRCFICINCQKPRTPKRMSGFINICRNCIQDAKEKGKIAQSNFINRAVNNFLKSLKTEVQNA